MLVAAIRPSSKEELIELWHRAIKICEHIELRVDGFQQIPWESVASVRPAIFTAGAIAACDVMRLASLKPPYLDIPEEMGYALFDQIKKEFPGIKLIASYHNYEKTDVDLEAVYERLRELPCDAVKIAAYAHSAIDALRLLSLMQRRGGAFPLIGVGMGECGAFTRILAPIYHSPISYCCLDEGVKTAPGQMTYEEMTSTYDFQRLSPATRPYALLGDPVHLSRSHLTHNKIFKMFDLDCVYVKICVKKQDFTSAFPLLRELGFRGLSLTMPLKYAMSQDTACNTVLLGDTVSLCNTDGAAAMDALEKHGSIHGKKLAVIGAGATAVSIAHAAAARGAHVMMFNRSQRKAPFPILPFSDLKKNLPDCSFCVQATSCGMNDEETLGIEPSWFSRNVIALDAVGKEDTSFLQAVRRAKGHAITGLDLFARQAAKQFAFWFPDLQESKILSALRRLLIPTSVHITKSAVSGTLTPPPSKSHTLRAIFCAAFADGISHIENPLMSPDTDAVIAICRNFGAAITWGKNSLEIRGIDTRRELASSHFDAKNSGIAMRFGVALSALFTGSIHWTGDRSMQQQRPIGQLLQAIEQLGASVTSSNGFAPCSVHGPLRAGTCSVDGADSQPVSALLIAASLLEGVTVIEVHNSGEKPWVDLTLHWLKRLGVEVKTEGHDRFVVAGSGPFKPFSYVVPADWSSALYPIAMALMTPSNLVVKGVDFYDPQGDKLVIDILEKMGARFHKDESKKSISIQGPQKLINRDIDVNDTIDAISLLAVVGCYAEGKMVIYNGLIARTKECDRIACAVRELKKMGAHIEERDDGLIVQQSKLIAADVACHDDHRMGLSLACAAMIAEGTTKIEGIGCMSKTYPGFFYDTGIL